MPASFTVNPRTGAVDYISVGMELLSVAAFKQGVRQGPGRGDADIQIVIPAYLCQEHFQRALPLLPGILKVRIHITRHVYLGSTVIARFQLERGERREE